MTRNQRGADGRQIAFDDVQICTAHAASSYAQQDIAAGDGRFGYFNDLEPVRSRIALRTKNGGLHSAPPADRDISPDVDGPIISNLP